MKVAPILLLALSLPQAPAAPFSHLRYMRSVASPSHAQSCAVLDAAIFAHSSSSLKDLRLLAAGEEVPYIITLSETDESTDEVAAPVNVQSDRAHTAFDLHMPPRAYTDVDLDLRQQNFVVTATVSGSSELASSHRIPLGTFTLFDLTNRHLSRNTVLALQESTFRYLHVELRGDRIASGAVVGAHVPPSRQGQTLYTSVVQTASLSREGNETVATLRIPAHVPLERVSINLPARFIENFARTVRITGRADGADGPVETIDGTIMQVTLGKIRVRRLAFDAGMGVNLQKDATIRIAIRNGQEGSLPVSSVGLEMRRRSICFSVPSAAPVLFYGDPTLTAPRYGYAPPHFERGSLPAALGPETLNPAFVDAPQTFLARRTGLPWLLFFGGFGAAGTVALHVLRRRSAHHG